jgi:hypothetical protein
MKEILLSLLMSDPNEKAAEDIFSKAFNKDNMIKVLKLERELTDAHDKIEQLEAKLAQQEKPIEQRVKELEDKVSSIFHTLNRHSGVVSIVQFDDDWRGIFIRGDNAMQFYTALEMLMDNPEAARDNPFSVVAPLQGLLQLLRSSNHHFEDADCQMLKKFEECKK